MKRYAVIGSVLAAALAAGMLSVPAFAASNPADQADSYSYNIGIQSYRNRMAEEHSWYDNEEDSVTAGYSFRTGTQNAQARNNIFAEMPAGNDTTKEDIAAWFESRGAGSGSAWIDGQYAESAQSGYGFAAGQAAWQQRHIAFTANN